MKHTLQITLWLFFGLPAIVFPQCALITDNFSGQQPNSVCAPVSMKMDVQYKFFVPIDPAKVEILYVWNDGTGATTQVPAISQGDTIFNQTQTHVYPPAGQCSYTAEAYVIYDGEQCVSSSRQEQTFSAWARDNENGAVLTTQPVVEYFCEGEDIVNVTFDDNTTFNCNINIEPDKPNRLNRWVQFIYGTQTIPGDRIPNVTVDDGMGNTYQLTDALGNSLGPVAGPIVEIPIPADGPNQTSFAISAPAGGVNGDIFEITMRNWNICNPYDASPYNGIPAGDTIDGDNAPITTTARIEIRESPAMIPNPAPTFCTGDNLTINVTSGGGTVYWYSDSALTQLLHTGTAFNPENPPLNLDADLPQTDTFYVVEEDGACQSPRGMVTMEVIESPTSAMAGPNDTVCQVNYQLQGNFPAVGTGVWTTTSGATIQNPSNHQSQVTNLDTGQNVFRWTTTNGPCTSFDEVVIVRDIQPDPANAGTDTSVCNLNSINLYANTPTNNGNGYWTALTPSLVFSDTTNPTSQLNQMVYGTNQLVWNVYSEFNACPATHDTINIVKDTATTSVSTTPDTSICHNNPITINGTVPLLNETALWSTNSSSSIGSPSNPQTVVSNLDTGYNVFNYQIQTDLGICPSLSDSTTIYRYDFPSPANAGMDKTLCDSTVIALSANAPAIGSGFWSIVGKPVGSNPQIQPDSSTHNANLHVQTTYPGIYTLTWNINNGSCINSDTVNIHAGFSPSTVTISPSDTTLCGHILDISGSLDTGLSGTWSLHSGPTTLNFMNGSNSPVNTIVTPDTVTGTYHIVWSATSGSCLPQSDTLEVTFKEKPQLPMAVNDSNCVPGPVLLKGVANKSNEQLTWYPDSVQSSIITHADSIFIPTLLSDTVFWITATNTNTLCESESVKVTGKIFNIPTAPVYSHYQQCGTDSFTIGALPGNYGNTIRWYDNDTSTLLSTSDSINHMLSQSDTLWLSSYNNATGCEGDKYPLYITLHPIPQAPAVSNYAVCDSGVVTLTAVPDSSLWNIQWYSDSLLTSVYDTGSSVQSPNINQLKTFYATALNPNNGCESVASEAVIEVFPTPHLPIVSDTSKCGGGNMVLSAQAGQYGTNVNWYNQLTGGSLLHGQTSFSTFLPGHGAYTYWLSSYNQTSGCESDRVRMDVDIFPVPLPNPITGNTEVPQGEENGLYTMQNRAGSVYEWSIPSELDTTLINHNHLILGFPDIGSYVLTGQETNSYGCKGPIESKNITVSDSVLQVNLSEKHPEVCSGLTLNITALPTGGTPGYYFQWWGDTANLAQKNGGQVNFNTNNPGQYQLYVRVTDANLKTAVDTVDITVHANPSIDIDNQDTVFCAGSNNLISTTASGGSGLYSLYNWTGSIETLSASDVANPVFSYNIQGFYPLQVEVTDTRGCKGETGVTIKNEKPVSSFETTWADACSPAAYQFTNTSENAVQYSWNFNDGTPQDTTFELGHIFTNTTGSIKYFNVTLSAFSESGCEAQSVQTVLTYPNPEFEIFTEPEYACAPAEVFIYANPGSFEYQWDFGDGTSYVSGYQEKHTYQNLFDTDTSYQIRLITESSLGCFDTSYRDITVYPMPDAAFDLSTQNMVFVPDSAIIITNQTEGDNWNYRWDFDDGNTSNSRNPQSHTFESAGSYDIKLVAESAQCADSLIKNVLLGPPKPVAKFAKVDPGCQPHTVTFVNASENAETYFWEFGDGSVSEKPNPTYTYYEYGKYKVRLTVKGKGGQDTASNVAEVHIQPRAFFEMAPRYVYVNDEKVHFFNLSDFAHAYEWDFGDGNTSTEIAPKHLYTKAGTYDVTLKAWTDNNCYDLFVMENAVFVQSSGRVVYPNAFRPDSPLEENRVFKPAIIDEVDEYHLMIFNRWGELIFESFHYDEGWDGTIQGSEAPQDVYIWKVSGTYISGQGFEKAGDVTLMR